MKIKKYRVWHCHLFYASYNIQTIQMTGGMEWIFTAISKYELSVFSAILEDFAENTNMCRKCQIYRKFSDFGYVTYYMHLITYKPYKWLGVWSGYLQSFRNMNFRYFRPFRKILPKIPTWGFWICMWTAGSSACDFLLEYFTDKSIPCDPCMVEWNLTGQVFLIT